MSGWFLPASTRPWSAWNAVVPRVHGARRGAHVRGLYALHAAAGTSISVDAKICIVDDAWMTCGSDNVNRRSWTHDSELTCAVVDPEGALLGALRRELWSEHLGLPLDDPRLDNLDAAQQLWRSRARERTGQVRVHEPAPVSRGQQLWAHPLQRLVPDGRPLLARWRRSF